MKSSPPAETINPFAEVDRTQSILKISMQIQKIAQRHHFDWNDVKGVIAKLYEELEEIVEAEANVIDRKQRLAEELGDILFTAISLARHCAIDPEIALDEANRKFERRFLSMVTILAENGLSMNCACRQELEHAWCEAKKRETKTPIA